MDLSSLTYDHILTTILVIMIAWDLIKKAKEMKRESDSEHAKRMRWDRAAEVLEEKEEKWDSGLQDVYNERSKIVERFDERLDELDERIDEIQHKNELRDQEIKAEMLILTRSVRAVLDGQIKQGVNGSVEEAKNKLDEYLMGKM